MLEYLNSNETAIERTQYARHVNGLMGQCTRKVSITMKHSPLLVEKTLTRFDCA